MKPFGKPTWMLLLGVLVCGFSLSRAEAQTPGGINANPINPVGTRPTVSPYLNLFRNGGTQGFNYLTLVRPELEARNSLRNLQQQVNLNRQSINDLSQSTTLNGAGIPATGRVGQFLNLGGYFMNPTGNNASTGVFTGGGVGTGVAGFNRNTGVGMPPMTRTGGRR